MNPPDAFALMGLARRLGACEISTSATNWLSLHHAALVCGMAMPAAIQPVGIGMHQALHDAWDAAGVEPTEDGPGANVITATIPGPVLLTLVAMACKVRQAYDDPSRTLEVPDAEFDLEAGIRQAISSFRIYLNDRDASAESVMARYWG